MNHYIVNGNRILTVEDVQEIENYLNKIDFLTDEEKFLYLPDSLIEIIANVGELPINGFWDLVKEFGGKIISGASTVVGTAINTIIPGAGTVVSIGLTALGDKMQNKTTQPATVFEGTRNGLPVRKSTNQTIEEYFVSRGPKTRSEQSFLATADAYGVSGAQAVEVFGKLFPDTPAVTGMKTYNQMLKESAPSSGPTMAGLPIVPLLIVGGLILLPKLLKK